jgi:hypothetical protein
MITVASLLKVTKEFIIVRGSIPNGLSTHLARARATAYACTTYTKSIRPPSLFTALDLSRRRIFVEFVVIDNGYLRKVGTSLRLCEFSTCFYAAGIFFGIGNPSPDRPPLCRATCKSYSIAHTHNRLLCGPSTFGNHSTIRLVAYHMVNVFYCHIFWIGRLVRLPATCLISYSQYKWNNRPQLCKYFIIPFNYLTCTSSEIFLASRRAELSCPRRQQQLSCKANAKYARDDGSKRKWSVCRLCVGPV